MIILFLCIPPWKGISNILFFVHTIRFNRIVDPIHSAVELFTQLQTFLEQNQNEKSKQNHFQIIREHPHLMLGLFKYAEIVLGYELCPLR